jgi:D-alanyl-lipoteichoic acid acyltransferase DltB (MBOAT superfamily)
VPAFKVLLPVGISFYTFQTLSYTIDVYRGERKPESHLGIFALYVAYFPQLVAGPIERSTRLLPQFYTHHDFDAQRVTEGLKRMLWGFFQKVVVADRLAIYVDAVYNNQAHHGGLTLIIATIFFTFQVYCDFAGYSNIAIGAARIMGYDLMENFKRPFFSTSVAEFWRRWHISLLTWFRDYLYIPLGGNRVSAWRWHFNILFVFFLCGIWHGANWTYVITLTLHGIFIIVSQRSVKFRSWIKDFLRLGKIPAFHKLLQIISTFALFSFSLIFFRSLSVSDALSIISKLFAFGHPVFIGNTSTFIFSIVVISLLVLVEIRQEFFPGGISLFENKHAVVRHLSYAAIVLIILLIGVFDGGQFIYFQF